jgi:putative ABC transport system permease protein
MTTAVRSLLRRPGFTLLAIGALAVGVGGTTAVYSLVHNVLIDGLPFDEPDRLVTPDVRSPQDYLVSLSIPYYQAWSERSRSFSNWGGSAGWTFIRTGAEGSELLNARLVLGDFFGTLGLRPALGRLPHAAETERGTQPAVVLGHGFWRRAFDGDPAVVGQSFVTDAFAGTIVGVLPAGAGFPSAEVEAYVSMGALDDLPWNDRESSFGMRAVARLAPGMTLTSAQADLDRIAAELASEHGQPVATPELRRLEDLFLGDIRVGLWTLLGAVGLLLLIACANVANLALARSEARARELAVRAALGAGRGRLMALLLTESALLAGAGGVVGLALAAGTVRFLPSLLPLDLPALLATRVALNAPVLAFAVLTTAVCAVLFSLVPALRAGGGGGPARLHSTVRAGAAGGREARRLRDGLVVVQVALSLILLIGAGLLMRSLHRLASVDKGFAAEDVITVRLQAPAGTFETPEQRHGFYDELVAQLQASPDVVSAAATLLVPLVQRSWERGILPDSRTWSPDEMESVLYNVVSPEYFATLGIPLRRGRGFETSDHAGARAVVVIDETMAERFWPGEDPIGRRVSFVQSHEGELSMVPEWLTVVGVAANVRHYELQRPSRIQVYLPMRQARPMGLSVAVRHRPGAGGAATVRLRRTVASLQPGIAFAELRPLTHVVTDALGPSRALGILTLLFGACAALLAALGIFGVLSLAVARRRQEFGVRMAVGATPARVLGLVTRYGVGLAMIGCALGLLGALAGNRLIAVLLFQVEPFDAPTYMAVTAAMLAVAVAAALAPAARAARTDPATVLRAE